MSNGHRGQVHVRVRQPAGALASSPGARVSRVAILVLVLAALLVGATDAQADTGVIPDTPDLPWTDPDHRSPLEVLSSQIASQIAGREVRVYCNGQNDWDILRAQRSIPENVWGYVAGQPYYIQSRVFVSSAPDTKLAPIACQYLWSFAKAQAKPTKCDASRTVTTSRTVTVRYKKRVAVKVTRRVKVNGMYVKRRVTVYRQVWRTRREQRTATTTVPLGRVPCYSAAEPGTTVAAPAIGEAEYRKVVFAISTLAHESIHLLDFTAGRSIDAVATTQATESRAECLGMQNIARVAAALGDTPDDAAALATYYALKMYPDRKTSNPDYWSPDCVQNGRLDQTPGDGVWP